MLRLYRVVCLWLRGGVAAGTAIQVLETVYVDFKACLGIVSAIAPHLSLHSKGQEKSAYGFTSFFVFESKFKFQEEEEI